MIRFFKKIPRKRKIQIGIVLIVILVIAGILIANKFFNIFAAGNEITNTATVYYNEGGVDKSAQSNTVITAVITPSPTPPSPSPSIIPSPSPTAQTMQISLNLQGRTDHSVTNGWLRIYNAGTSTLVYERSDISLASNGQGQTTMSGLSLGQSYNCRFKAPYFLTTLVTNVQYTTSVNVNFGLQRGGDIDNNNIINSIDFAVLSSKWGQSDPISDINKDGTVNTMDFSILNSNWFSQGN